MKYILILFLFTPFIVKSQFSYKGDKSTITNFSFSISPTFVIPFGNLNDAYENGYGGLITLSKHINENSELFIEGGYISFKGKSISVASHSLSFPNMQHIPLTIGGKYINEKFNFGFGVGVGKYWLTDSDPTYGFMINPSIGYDIGPIVIGVNYSLTSLNSGVTKNGNSNTYLGLKFNIKLPKAIGMKTNFE